MAAQPPVLLADDFTDVRAQGAVLGSPASDGTLRRGADAEGTLGIDHGALRLGYFERAGWGRHGLAYGPYPRRPGLALAVLLLNGHNNSQTNPSPEPWWKRQARRLARRLLFLWPEGRVPPRPPSPYHTPPLRENLAVGWFPEAAPPSPVGADAFVVRATGGANGDLYTAGRLGGSAVVQSLQNVPTCYVVLLREQGAAYYAASLPGAHGCGAYPSLRPLAIETEGRATSLYAGVWQGVLGEIGFHVDTRVYGVRAAQLDACASWYGTAHAADPLRGAGELVGSPAEVGGTWFGPGGFDRSDAGARATRAGATALLTRVDPSGLLHVVFTPSASGDGVGLVFRAEGTRNHWCLRLDGGTARLEVVHANRRHTVAAASCAPAAGRDHTLMVQDDGARIGCYLDGVLLFDRVIEDIREADAAGLGIYAPTDAGATVRAFEAHPRAIPLPDGLVPAALPWVPAPGATACADTFTGATGDLEGRATSLGARTWHRLTGTGRFSVRGGRACVLASRETPNPGRTAYGIPWHDPHFADLEVEIIPPGTRRGEGHQGRGGIVVWQDAQHYFIVNTWLDDVYDGTSVSSFFVLGGKEDLFRAVWTNVGRRITWGVPYRMRVTTNGLFYQVSIDGEPVLYRSLQDVYPAAQPLRIHRVGLAANWEWGDDTGSCFRNFVARSSQSEG